VKRFYSNTIEHNSAQLSEQEAHHAIHVLRCIEGEEVEVVNGKGFCWQGKISPMGKKGASVAGLVLKEELRENPQQLSLAISPPKNADRMEWAIEKAIEIGVKEIIPIQCARSERSRLNMDRLRQIALSAMKQSGHLFLPDIHQITPLADLWHFPASQHFLAHCIADSDRKMLNLACLPGKSVLIAIGPEGDFTREEIMASHHAGWLAVSLGNSRLRVETAAIFAAAVVKMLNGM